MGEGGLRLHGRRLVAPQKRAPSTSSQIDGVNWRALQHGSHAPHDDDSTSWATRAEMMLAIAIRHSPDVTYEVDGALHVPQPFARCQAEHPANE